MSPLKSSQKEELYLGDMLKTAYLVVLLKQNR